MESKRGDMVPRGKKSALYHQENKGRRAKFEREVKDALVFLAKETSEERSLMEPREIERLSK